MTQEEAIRRGHAAQRLLADETAMSALDQIKADAAEKWGETRPDDKDGREDAYRLCRAVDLVKSKLTTWAGEAQLEVHNAAQRQRDAQSG